MRKRNISGNGYDKKNVLHTQLANNLFENGNFILK